REGEQQTRAWWLELNQATVLILFTAIALFLLIVFWATGAIHNIERMSALRYLYILSAICFVLGLKGLSSPRWARRGMFLAEFGMLVAIVGTLFQEEIQGWGYLWIMIGLTIGSFAGGTMGLQIPMTAVPQRTALSHSLGALAATLVGISEYI